MRWLSVAPSLPETAVSDPGMSVKMTSPGLADLDVWLTGGVGDLDAVADLVDFVESRWDCSDFRLITLIKLLHAAPALPEDERAAIEAAVLGFRYWMDEPGRDSMCFWSENHQILFFTCAYLAGGLFPTATFTNSGVTGATLRARARPRLQRWLAARFSYGFTEWTSTTYYEEDAAALAMLVVHAGEDDMVASARTCLDLLFLDLALHHFDSRMVASSGRAYERQSKQPETADVNQLIRWAFHQQTADFDLSRMSGVVVTGDYQVPDAVVAIAHDTTPTTIRTSSGLDLEEVSRVVGPRLDIESTGMQFWLQEAFTTPESIEITLKTLREWNLRGNVFLSPLQSFRHLRGRRILPGLIRLLNPATSGVAIQRADVVTHRSPHAQLSSAQRHHPGNFGDQQLIWIAGLPSNVNVYGTHPAQPMFDGAQRNFSPSEWVGNGILPDVAQHGPALLAVYDTTPRRGILERGRLHKSHVFVPHDRLDEVRFKDHLVVGRSAGGYIAILGAAPLQRKGDAYVQHGRRTAWAVLVSGEHDMSFPAFTERAEASRLRLTGGTTTFRHGEEELQLAYGGDFTVDGQIITGDHPRFDTPWVKADRFPTRIDITAGSHRLSLHRPESAGHR